MQRLSALADTSPPVARLNLLQRMADAVAAVAPFQLINDRAGNKVPRLPEAERKELKNKVKAFKALLPDGSAHQRILSSLEDRVRNELGAAGVEQFYSGAHIVLNDGGKAYNRVKDLGDSIAAKKPDGSLMNKKEFAGKMNLPYGPNLVRLQAGAMFERRPNESETSHYEHEKKLIDPEHKDVHKEDRQVELEVGPQHFDEYREHDYGYKDNVPPQLGIDFPLAAGGHILIGIVPEHVHKQEGDEGSVGNTFVQTEGAGFQSFWQGVPMHLLGGFANWGWLPGVPKGTQTGLLGQTGYSEKRGTELRGADQK